MQQYEELNSQQVLEWYSELKKKVGAGQARKLISSILYGRGKTPQEVSDLMTLIPIR